MVTLTLNGPGFLVDLKAGEGLNQDALVFDVLYGYFSLKTWIHGLKWKFGSPVHNAQEGYKKDFLNFGLACSIQSFELSLRW